MYTVTVKIAARNTYDLISYKKARDKVVDEKGHIIDSYGHVLVEENPDLRTGNTVSSNWEILGEILADQRFSTGSYAEQHDGGRVGGKLPPLSLPFAYTDSA